MHMFLLIILSLSVFRVHSQTCLNAKQYDRCSSNIACGCLPFAAYNNNDGVCVQLYRTCSELTACAFNNQMCFQPGHVCVKHPRCLSHPVCYPADSISQRICPSLINTTPRPPLPTDGICVSATWNKNGVTVIGEQGAGDALNQLLWPEGIFMDENDDMYIVENGNNRVMKFARGASSGQIVAGGNGEGNKSNQFFSPRDVAVAKNGTMYICDQRNSRVQRWLKDAKDGDTIVANIECFGLTIDKEGFLYLSDWEKKAIRKWPNGEIVAGGNGDGEGLNQLPTPGKIFLDQEGSLYVTGMPHRVLKWPAGAKEGIVVAGGNGFGNDLDQLEDPTSVIVDQTGTVYVTDEFNFRVMRWFKDAKAGIVIAGGDGRGIEANQLYDPADLAFDHEGNLYVVDSANHRIQKFLIDKSSCTTN